MVLIWEDSRTNGTKSSIDVQGWIEENLVHEVERIKAKQEHTRAQDEKLARQMDSIKLKALDCLQVGSQW